MVAPGAEVATLQIGELLPSSPRAPAFPPSEIFAWPMSRWAAKGRSWCRLPTGSCTAGRGSCGRCKNFIGGIANVTAVVEERSEVRAFYCGHVNMMLDALAPAASHGADTVDRDGRYSQTGTVQPDLLAQLLDDEFLRRPPPKSTGRERYGAAATLAWAAQNPNRRPVDLLATLVAFAATAIADSYRYLPRAPDEVLVSGGGAHNQTLMAALAARVACPVRRLQDDPANIPRRCEGGGGLRAPRRRDPVRAPGKSAGRDRRPRPGRFPRRQDLAGPFAAR